MGDVFYSVKKLNAGEFLFLCTLLLFFWIKKENSIFIILKKSFWNSSKLLCSSNICCVEHQFYQRTSNMLFFEEKNEISQKCPQLAKMAMFLFVYFSGSKMRVFSPQSYASIWCKIQQQSACSKSSAVCGTDMERKIWILANPASTHISKRYRTTRSFPLDQCWQMGMCPTTVVSFVSADRA